MLTARPSSKGCSTWLSSCITAMMMPSTITAVTQPLVTNAMNTAMVPARKAPTIGMNALMNTSEANGKASGTPRIARPAPMPMASTSATTTVARTNPTSVPKPSWPAVRTFSRCGVGTIRVTKCQI